VEFEPVVIQNASHHSFLLAMKPIAILLLVGVSTTGICVGQVRMDTVQWLTESSFDLQTSNPDAKIEGVPFEKIFADVKMVMVGEATHGTKEFAEMKDRLFRYLVENMGFRYFFVEADFTAGLAVDRYICGEGGDPVDVLKGLRFYHIVNKEGLALITWMKSFNETKGAGDKIRFFGMDCTISADALAELKDYFRRVDTEFYDVVKAMNVRNHRPDLPKLYRMESLSRDTIQLFQARLATYKTRYVDASSEMDYKIAVRFGEALSQSFEISQAEATYAKREEFMAANVEWVLNEIEPGPKKAFLWAHNDHVMYGNIMEGSGKLVGSSLGTHIKNSLDGKVYSVGQYFNYGSFVANEIKKDSTIKRVWHVDENPDNRFLYLMSRTNMDALFMDFHSIHNTKLVSWLRDNRVSGYDVGGAYYPTNPSYNSSAYPLLKCFDGLIFVNCTHGITLELPRD
jgi:erythromycin esterase